MSEGKREAIRSEFLFCYDARMTNPNGDPDENRPRIDVLTRRNLVTDFRFKRTIRDYIWKKYRGHDEKGKKIFMRAEEKDAAGHFKEVEDLGESYLLKGKNKKGDPIVEGVDKDRLLQDHIDVRLFGLLFAVSGASFKRVGPVQFAIGQSLNPVEEIPIRMTRIVPTKEGAQAGTFGDKSILRYSFIVFHGFLNDAAAKETYLTEDDVSEMIEAIWYGTSNLSTTSKYGQQSRLLLRLKYKQPLAYIGDLDRRVMLSAIPPLMDLSKTEDLYQVALDVTRLSSTVDANAAILSGIDFFESPDLVCTNDSKKGKFSDVFTKSVHLNRLS